MELADVLDSKSVVAIPCGSTSATGTKEDTNIDTMVSWLVSLIIQLNKRSDISAPFMFIVLYCRS